MPSDLIRGWTPVRRQKMRSSKEKQSEARFHKSGIRSSGRARRNRPESARQRETKRKRAMDMFDLGNFPVLSGFTIPNAKLAYKTHGTLSPA